MITILGICGVFVVIINVTSARKWWIKNDSSFQFNLSAKNSNQNNSHWVSFRFIIFFSTIPTLIISFTHLKKFKHLCKFSYGFIKTLQSIFMPLEIKFSILPFIGDVVLISNVLVLIRVENPCKTPDGLNGSCVLLQQCRPLMSLLTPSISVAQQVFLRLSINETLKCIWISNIDGPNESDYNPSWNRTFSPSRQSHCGFDGADPLVCCSKSFTIDDLPTTKFCGQSKV